MVDYARLWVNRGILWVYCCILGYIMDMLGYVRKVGRDTKPTSGAWPAGG